MSGSETHAHLPLRTVSRLTGLSPDILRAWERRYQVVCPKRGPRGSRLYSADDVAHLRLLATLVAEGRSIGDVARMNRDHLEQLAAVTVTPATTAETVLAPEGHVVAQALEALAAFDSGCVHRVLSDALIGFGVVRFIESVANPLLREVGDRWNDGSLSVADEHLVSGVLRGLLSSILHSRGPSGGQKVLIATPSGERHEFGALIAALIAADAGLDVAYLGSDIPGAEIADAADRCNARAVIVGLVNTDNHDRAVAEVREIAAKIPITTELWIGGADAAKTTAELGITAIRLVSSTDSVRPEVVRLRAENPRAI